MFKPVELFIGLRYLRAKRRSHFISFISLMSIIGVGLGVMALITVLSVMNGFEKELTNRILGMASHATIAELHGELRDWQKLAGKIQDNPEVIGVAPYFHAEGMLVNDARVNGAIIRGILPTEEPKVSIVSEKMVAGDFTKLTAGEFGIIIGQELAAILGVTLGDKVTLVAPQSNVTPAGIIPRLKRFTVVGIFRVGMNEFDSALALLHIEDALRLFRKTAPTGLRLKMKDMMTAPSVALQIAEKLPGQYWVRNWTQQHKNFFRALKMEKTVMFFILMLIVAVAAFNIICTLVMIVTDKQADIALLRALGASRRTILSIFIIQGTMIGAIGIILGVISGVWLASSIETIIPVIENLLETKFLPADVYYISDIPSDMQWNDVGTISVIAFILSVIATIYPAWLAANIQPAEALRYE